MFEHILKYLNKNNNKTLLIYYLKDYSHKSVVELAIFLNKNGYYVNKLNRYMSIKNNTNKILIAGNIDHLIGHHINDFIFFGDYDNLSDITYIKNNIIFCNMYSRNYYNKNIILERYFKNI